MTDRPTEPPSRIRWSDFDEAPPSIDADRIGLGWVVGELLAHAPDSRAVEVVSAYLETLPSPSTRADMRTALDLVASTATRGQRDANELAWWRMHPFMIVVVRHELADRSRAVSTLRRTMSACRGIFGTCHRLDLLDASSLHDLLDAARQRAPLQQSCRVLSAPQIDTLLASCRGTTLALRDRALLALIISLLQLPEITALTREDWDPSTRSIRVTGHRVRTIVLDPRYADLVQAWVERRRDQPGSLLSPMHRGHRTGAPRPLSLGAVRDIVRARAARAGLGRLTPTDLRRTALVRAFAEGWSATEVAVAAGLYDAKGLGPLKRLARSDER